MDWIRDEKLIEVAMMSSLPMNINDILVMKNPYFSKQTPRKAVQLICVPVFGRLVSERPLAAPDTSRC